MKCLIFGCNREAESRGLCWPCYQSAYKKVKHNKTTWEKLINANMARKAIHNGRSGGIFDNMYKEKIGE